MSRGQRGQRAVNRRKPASRTSDAQVTGVPRRPGPAPPTLTPAGHTGPCLMLTRPRSSGNTGTPEVFRGLHLASQADLERSCTGSLAHLFTPQSRIESILIPGSSLSVETTGRKHTDTSTGFYLRRVGLQEVFLSLSSLSGLHLLINVDGACQSTAVMSSTHEFL